MKSMSFLGPLCALVICGACDNKASTATQSNPVSAASATASAMTLAPGIHDRVGAVTMSVTVDTSGFNPSSMMARGGTPVALMFTRIAEDSCGKEVVFPSLNIRKELPLNQAVQVTFDMPASGAVAFECGMGMLKGSIIVQ